ncbi:MAG: M24 family metallopeptidase [Candidatus Heimdallarchaeaceae archaeon]
MSEKIARSQEVLKKHDTDGWLIFSHHSYDIHTKYFLEHWFASPTAVFIPKEGKAIVITSIMESMMVDENAFDVRPYKKGAELFDYLREILNKQPEKSKVALNIVSPSELLDFFAMDILAHGTAEALKQLNPKLEYTSAREIIFDVRSVKTQKEIENHKKAAELAEELMKEEIEPIIKPGITEKELAARINYECNKRGGVAFDAIVASGPHSAIPHHSGNDTKLKENQVLLIDYGVAYNLSNSDITHTYWIGPKDPPEEVERAYQAVDSAKRAAFKAIKAGVISSEVHEIVKQTFKDFGYDPEKYFLHSTGHPLGIETHDIGIGIRQGTEEAPGKPLIENSVITVEPGLYFQGKFGIRLEDDVVVTKSGIMRLTNTPSELLVL